MAGKSNRKIIYACTQCGREVGRDNLRVKRAVFKDMGQHGRALKTRVTAWLCIIPQADGSPSCCDLDPDWTAEPLVGTPGLADTALGGGSTAPASGPAETPSGPATAPIAPPDPPTPEGWGSGEAFMETYTGGEA